MFQRGYRGHGFVPFLASTALAVAAVSAIIPLVPAVGTYSTKQNALVKIKALAGAVRVYTMDYDGCLPGWVNNNPRGAPLQAHNAWDQQIRPWVKSNWMYTDGQAGIRSYSQPGRHDRVITYGLNGLLITPPLANITGNANFSNSTQSMDHRYRLADIPSPAGTILLAELSTATSMPREYGGSPFPKPYTYTGGPQSSEWIAAVDGWIDVSPRAFIENGSPVAACFAEPWATGCTNNGIARNLYDGGGSYAFCDGHVEFLPIKDSVGIGKLVGREPIVTANCWAGANYWNLWYPVWHPAR